MIPNDVVRAYGWQAAEIAALPGGLINATHVVRRGAPLAVVQHLHPIFDGRVNLDLEAVTRHLAERGMTTPRLIRTLDDRTHIEVDGRVWRALTWVDGETVHRVPDPTWAEAGGELVGRFHRAVADLRHDYSFTRAGVHDTAVHLARLEDDALASDDDVEATNLAREILDAAGGLPRLHDLPVRHCHGDLKISNLLFREGRGVALVDLDTLGRGTMAFELGDAMRSWCNPSGEDAAGVHFDLPIFAAAMRGVRSVAGKLIIPDEWRAVVIGLEIVCIELAARFAVDVFRDSYFGWDAARFPSRRAHNLVRARAQLALGLAVRAARADALDTVLAGT